MRPEVSSQDGLPCFENSADDLRPGHAACDLQPRIHDRIHDISHERSIYKEAVPRRILFYFTTS
jgi:hypothetical protein